jgi:hypothetical protein
MFPAPGVLLRLEFDLNVGSLGIRTVNFEMGLQL